MERYHFTADQRALLEGLLQPLAIYQFVDKRVVTLILSDGFCEIFGYNDRAQAYSDMDNDMYKDAHPDDVARIADAAFRFATEGGTYEAIYRTKTKHVNEYRIVHAMGKHVLMDDGTRLAHVWYTDEGPYTSEEGGDHTELRRAFSNALHEESLVRASCYDYLTGLPNMTYFFELADAGKRTILENGGEPVLLYIDLIGMKFFNTQHGFAAGDELLREFANALKGAFSNENCCRIGTDHFAAFTEASGLENRLEQLFHTVKRINGGNSLAVRVGIYPNRLGDVPVSTACDRAKLACDSLRNAAESSFSYYERGLSEASMRRSHILANLDRAIEERWIQVHYQPIVRAVNGKVCDEEALSRWIDPELGPLSPADFISILEDAGTVYKLDLYVLDQVLEKMRNEAAAGLEVVPHSINLSRANFVACDIVNEILKRVDAAGIERSQISIEITESAIGSDFEFMKGQIERLRSLGFPVWMDDFGSGYSSIDLLQSVEFDLIKFDMSFMRRLGEGDAAKIVLTELMRMVTALGVDTICEGVETHEQVRFLQEIGCSKLQGFHFCRAIPLEDIIERYAKGVQIGYENPDESPYFDAIGRVNLYDLALIEGEDDELRSFFNILPVCVMEIGDDKIEFVRSNEPYRDFAKRFFGFDLDDQPTGYDATPKGAESAFISMARQCCETGGRAFFDEVMPNGAVVHSFVRWIGRNPVTGNNAVAVAALSIANENEHATSSSTLNNDNMIPMTGITIKQVGESEKGSTS